MTKSLASFAAMKMHGRTFDQRALEQKRMLAIKRIVEDGESPGEFMESIGLRCTTIHPCRLIKKYLVTFSRKSRLTQ